MWYLKQPAKTKVGSRKLFDHLCGSILLDQPDYWWRRIKPTWISSFFFASSVVCFKMEYKLVKLYGNFNHIWYIVICWMMYPSGCTSGCVYVLVNICVCLDHLLFDVIVEWCRNDVYNISDETRFDHGPIGWNV